MAEVPINEEAISIYRGLSFKILSTSPKKEEFPKSKEFMYRNVL